MKTISCAGITAENRYELLEKTIHLPPSKGRTTDHEAPEEPLRATETHLQVPVRMVACNIKKGKSMTLDELGKKYRTDKSSLLHDYLTQYEALFPRERVTGVAEIGVRRGGKWRNNHAVPSLKVWQEWFYNAQIYGMDLKRIDPAEPNITLFIGDQSSEKDLKAFAELIGQVDMIIDDGSHRPPDQLLSFLTLRDCIKPGGVYVIEDCRAEVTREYKQTIHSMIGGYSEGFSVQWGASRKVGEQSILFLRK